MSSAAEGTLAERIERELARRAEVYAAVEVRGDEVILSGMVDTPEARQAADDIVAELAPDKRLTNDLEVETVQPIEVSDFYAGEAPSAPVGPGGLVENVEELAEREEDLDPDLTDQPLDTSGLAMAGVDPAEEAETTFFPPTDPVVTTDDRGEVEVLGGFSPTSDDDVGVDRSASDDQYGDEAIAEAVRRELREDAATTDLHVDVEVRQGVVSLRGSVPDVDDAENAEEVAGRVPGVEDVEEDLHVEAIGGSRRDRGRPDRGRFE